MISLVSRLAWSMQNKKTHTHTYKHTHIDTHTYKHTHTHTHTPVGRGRRHTGGHPFLGRCCLTKAPEWRCGWLPRQISLRRAPFPSTFRSAHTKPTPQPIMSRASDECKRRVNENKDASDEFGRLERTLVYSNMFLRCKSPLTT